MLSDTSAGGLPASTCSKGCLALGKRVLALQGKRPVQLQPDSSASMGMSVVGIRLSVRPKSY